MRSAALAQLAVEERAAAEAADTPAAAADAPAAAADAPAATSATVWRRRLRGGGRPLLGAEAFRRTLTQALAADPRPLYRWRRDQSNACTTTSEPYSLDLDGVRVRCCFERAADGLGARRAGGGAEEVVTVLSIEPLHDQAAT